MAIKNHIYIRGKKVLLVGLGTLGGGLTTAKWLLKQGACLTITDLRTPKELKSSLADLKKHKDKDIEFVLGRHRQRDFIKNDIIVVNPGISFRNPFIKMAFKHGKQIENELTLFNKMCRGPLFGVTGTRGKTTTVNWLTHFLKQKYPKAFLAGNSPQDQFLKMVGKCEDGIPVVIEAPSFLLEFIGASSERTNKDFNPEVALITNIYRDHLDRYNGIKDYASTKANIFRNQQKGKYLILNAGNSWTQYFLKQKPAAKVFYFSLKPLGRKQSGIFVDKKLNIYIKRGQRKKLFYDAQLFIERWGRHNLENLIASALAARIFGIPVPRIVKAIESLPQILFREQVVYKSKKLEIINDTAATSPEATIAALERFAPHSRWLVLITGGTDKKLDYKKWAVAVQKHVPHDNIVFLNGSATKKMIKALKYAEGNVFESLKACLNRALKIANKAGGKSIVLFSPGAKSFEKFKNEFDRGRKFNELMANIK